VSGVVSDFDVVKALIEARNPRLAVGTYEYCEWRTVRRERVRRRFEGVCVGHRDGSLMDGRKTGGNQQWILYRSKRDFVMMLLGCESAAAREFRAVRRSPLIKPMVGSMEEMRIQLAARGVDLEKTEEDAHEREGDR